MKVNALQIRQSFGKILKKLQGLNEPIIIEKGKEPVAVIISLKTFNERFIDYQEQKKRDQLLDKFKDSAIKVDQNTVEALREIRYGSNN